MDSSQRPASPAPRARVVVLAPSPSRREAEGQRKEINSPSKGHKTHDSSCESTNRQHAPTIDSFHKNDSENRSDALAPQGNLQAGAIAPVASSHAATDPSDSAATPTLSPINLSDPQSGSAPHFNQAPPRRPFLSLNQLIYVRVKLDSQASRANTTFKDTPDFQKAFLEQLSELKEVKESRVLQYLNFALSKHTGLSHNRVKGSYFTAGFAFSDEKITLNFTELLMKIQASQPKKSFTFKLPTIVYGSSGSKHSTQILSTKIKFALEKEHLIDTFFVEFTVRVPFTLSQDPMEEFSHLLASIIFSNTKCSQDELQKEKDIIQSYCLRPNDIVVSSKATLSIRSFSGRFPLNLDDPSSRDALIAQRLVFASLYGLDPRPRQHDKFLFTLPILADGDQLSKRSAFKTIVEEVRENPEFESLIVIRPRRVRRASSSDSASDSSEPLAQEYIEARFNALQTLPQVPLIVHDNAFESEEFPPLHMSRSFKPQPVGPLLPSLWNATKNQSAETALDFAGKDRIVIMDDRPKPVCKYYGTSGGCKHGQLCRYLHEKSNHQNPQAENTVQKNKMQVQEDVAQLVSDNPIQSLRTLGKAPSAQRNASSEILACIAKNPLCPNFHICKDTIHKPFTSKSIIIDGNPFTEEDYGASYGRFWDDINLDQSLRNSDQGSESMRCLFIHLGLAAMIHPFALQQAFRLRAQLLMNTAENHSSMAVRFLDSLKDTLAIADDGRLCSDCNILLSCWPSDWKPVRIIIWQAAAKSWLVFEPFPDENNEEFILSLSSGHYTLLSHWSQSFFNILRMKKDQTKLEIIEPREFSIIIRENPQEPMWEELCAPFSFHSLLIAFYHNFDSRKLIHPSSTDDFPQEWPPLNLAERFVASFFPQPCKQSGHFHSCCGSSGNCGCGLSTSDKSSKGCTDPLCQWKSDEDPYHFAHDLTPDAYAITLERIKHRLPSMIERFNVNEDEAKAALALVLVDRIIMIYISLQRILAKMNSQEERYYHDQAMTMIPELCSEAQSILDSMPPSLQARPQQFLSSLIDIILKSTPLSQPQDSIASTQSDDVAIITSNPRYAREIEEECARTFNFVKHLYITATKRLHTITEEGKLVAIRQLEGLHSSMAAIVSKLSALGTGLASLPPKRALNLEYFDLGFEQSLQIRDELTSLIQGVSDTQFPKAPPLSKKGKKAGTKSIIDPKLLASLTKTIEEIFAASTSSNPPRLFARPQAQAAEPRAKSSSNSFALLAELEEELKESSNENDEEDNQSQDDETAAHEEVIRKRLMAGSTASIFLAEARNVQSKDASDSFDSAATMASDSQDRQFVNDASQESTGQTHRLLFHSQVLRDAGLIQQPSPRKQPPVIPIIYCPRGHHVVTPYKVPSDNMRRKLDKVICSVCLDQIDPRVMAHNCVCVTHIVCGKCVQSPSSFPKPPSCRTCTNDLHFSHCTGRTCVSCESPFNRRTELWVCSEKSCRATFCTTCIPPPASLLQTQRPQPSTSSSFPSSSAPSSKVNRGQPAPMRGKPGQ
jgi:hypothetical protein